MATVAMKQSIKWHLESINQVLINTPIWIYFAPLLFMLILVGLDQTALSAYLDKDTAETTAPIILCASLVFTLWQVKKNAHVYFKWLAFFAFILFVRELHFYGTNNGFYIGFLLMIWWASRYRERLMPFFQNKMIVSFVVLIVWTYLISKSFDRHYWDNILPAGIESDLFEENLELVGHLLFFNLVIFSSKLKEY